MDLSQRLLAASVVSVVAQVVHGLVPADTEAEGYVGLVGGLVLLVASLAAVYGLKLGRTWAPTLAGATGLVIAVGVTGYHVAPFHGPVTNPYIGEGVGVAAWLSVLAVVGAGLWCGYESFAASSRPTRSPAPTG